MSAEAKPEPPKPRTWDDHALAVIGVVFLAVVGFSMAAGIAAMATNAWLSVLNGGWK